jgi:hypothetical protein
LLSERLSALPEGRWRSTLAALPLLEGRWRSTLAALPLLEGRWRSTLVPAEEERS